MAATIDIDAGLNREDFPILATSVRGRALAYLDNAATSQKPTAVIDAIDHYYRQTNSNVHRGLHHLSEQATNGYEAARGKVQQFIHASSSDEIVFVRGTTEAINLVAQSYARPTLKAGDEILITTMEHHSNIVPWQIVCAQTGATLRVAAIDDHGQLDLDSFRRQLSHRTRLVSLTHVSNALGTINPIEQLISQTHEAGAVVMIDGAQAAPHLAVDVQALECDFYAFSGHKAYGPTGIGVLYGRAAHLNAMPPYQGGGEMIRSVTFEKTTYKAAPARFEAGTPHIAGAIGLGAAIEYVQNVGLDRIGAQEEALLTYATQQLSAISGLRIIGTAEHKAAVISFVLDNVHPHDLATILDTRGVAIRAGHHCAQPVMQRFKVPATARISLAFYNNRADIDAAVEAIRTAQEMFR